MFYSRLNCLDFVAPNSENIVSNFKNYRNFEEAIFIRKEVSPAIPQLQIFPKKYTFRDAKLEVPMKKLNKN